MTELKDCHCLYQLHLPGLEINLGIVPTAFINVDNTLSQKFKPCICHMFELIYLTFYNDTFFHISANLLIVFSKGKTQTPSSKCRKIIALVLVLNFNNSQFMILFFTNQPSLSRHENFPNIQRVCRNNI